jgi:hypothetical protein
MMVANASSLVYWRESAPTRERPISFTMLTSLSWLRLRTSHQT